MRCLLVLVSLFVAIPAYAGDSRDQSSGTHGHERQMPKVYDAQGKYVGHLSNLGNGVYLTIDGAVAFVSIERVRDSATSSATQFRWASANIVYYASSDCSGPPIIDASNGARPATAVRVGADVVLYVAGDADSTTLHAGSKRQAPNLNVCGQITQNGDIKKAFSSESTFPLTQEYPEPLTIEP